MKRLTINESKAVGFRLPNFVLARIGILAQNQGISRNEWVNAALLRAIRKHTRKG